MRVAVLCCVIAGCAYRPGSFAWFEGTRVSLGCLDLAVHRRQDMPIGPVIEYQFGNRCDHAATVDLGALVVQGRAADGSEVELRPYDPEAEIHPVTLDGRAIGGEALAYPSEVAIAEVCVDVAPLVPAAPARWVCAARVP